MKRQYLKIKQIYFTGYFTFSVIWETNIFQKACQVWLYSFYGKRKSERLPELLQLLCQWLIPSEKRFGESWDFRSKSLRVHYPWIICASFTTLSHISLHWKCPFTIRLFSTQRVYNWWSCPWSERSEKKYFAWGLWLLTKLLGFSVDL